MSIQIQGATTAQVRQLAVALHRAGHTGELQVGVEGPECWGARTPKLTADEFALVIGQLVHWDGVPIADHLLSVMAASN